MRLPNLFIVGAGKCGTTSAHAYLRQSPEIFAPPGVKEPHYFGKDLKNHPHEFLMKTVHGLDNHHWIDSLEEYARLYADAPEGTPYLLDASASYLYSATAAEEIASVCPEARIVILLRDPVRRAWSEYQMNLAIGLEWRSFRRAVMRERAAAERGRPFLLAKYTSAGRYYAQVERFLKQFPRQNVLVEIVDEPGRNMADVNQRIASFLSIPSTGLEAGVHENQARAASGGLLNNIIYHTGIKALLSRHTPAGVKARIRRHAYRKLGASAPSETDARFIREYFADEYAVLGSLIGADLSHWYPPVGDVQSEKESA